MSDPNPYHRLLPPPPSLTRGLSTPSRPSSGPFHSRFGPFYARFQPILGTQKCFPRDFRDQFSKFPKISWLGELFFKIVSRILGGAKGRFCPVAGGGWVALCLPACRRSRCPVLRSWPVPGLDRPGIEDGRPGLDHYRRTLQARPGSIGPASSRAFLALYRYCYTGFLALPALWPGTACFLPCGGLSRVRWPAIPARWRSWAVGLL